MEPDQTPVGAGLGGMAQTFPTPRVADPVFGQLARDAIPDNRSGSRRDHAVEVIKGSALRRHQPPVWLMWRDT